MKDLRGKSAFLVSAALIAALYAGLTVVLAGISYGAVQFRVAEALCMLACVTPAAIPGLTLGCLISNMMSPFGLIDMIFGTAATLLASVLSYRLRKITFKGLPLVSALPPVLINAVAVAAQTVMTSGTPNVVLFGTTALWVALGEAVVVFVPGMFLYLGVTRSKPIMDHLKK